MASTFPSDNCVHNTEIVCPVIAQCMVETPLSRYSNVSLFSKPLQVIFQVRCFVATSRFFNLLICGST